MGYTHYWYLGGEEGNVPVPPEAFGHTLLDAKHLFQVAAEQGYDLAGPLGDGEPELTEGRLAFNGRNPDQSYETFSLAPGDRGFDCCKIGFMAPESFRAYGDVVEALLIRAKTLLDGRWKRIRHVHTWESIRGSGQRFLIVTEDGEEYTSGLSFAALALASDFEEAQA
jgi:hypothetical protein